jgi:hypothetical protein
LFDYLHGCIAKQISPTDTGDAGAKFDAFAMRTQIAFDKKDEIVMGSVAAEIPGPTGRDPSPLQMAHPVEAALRITVSAWRHRAKWPGRSRNMPGRRLIGSTLLWRSVLSARPTRRLFDCT